MMGWGKSPWSHNSHDRHKTDGECEEEHCYFHPDFFLIKKTSIHSTPSGLHRLTQNLGPYF